MTGGKQGGGGDDWLRSTRPIGFLFWDGRQWRQYGLQPLSPLLIKLNKATLNWGDQKIFSSIDEWAFNLGLGGHWHDPSRGCCHDPHLWLLVSFGEGRQSRRYFWFLAKIRYQLLFKLGITHRKLRNGQAGPSPSVVLCTKRYPYCIRMITKQYAQFWVLCSS